MNFRRLAGRVLAIAGAALMLTVPAVLARAAQARSASGTVSLVAYSTPRDAYGQIIPAFQETSSGRGTSFQQSYGASGEQARAVVAGLRADVVALSLEPDMTTLVKAGLVARNWKNDKFGGIVTRSVVVFVVRNGNPEKIRNWSDLIKPGIDVVTPNVQTSGGAKWNVMAAYGAQRKTGKTHAQAVAYLKKLYDHVISQDKSAREALQTFLAGRGDVLLAYENEAIFARKHDQPINYVIPKSTIRIENPVAVSTNSTNKPTARAFVRFLREPTAQRIFAENGYRPLLPSVARDFAFPVRPLQFNIKWLGGWARVDRRFFDPRTGIVTQIQRRRGG